MNTLVEMPSKIGGIPLSFEKFESYPRRFNRGKGDHQIHIPLRPGMMCSPIKGGAQFILKYPVLGVEEHLRGLCLFGGMDESPFLTALESKPIERFETEGEVGFFDALIPKEIKSVQAKYPEAPFGRQGDIWYIRLPHQSGPKKEPPSRSNLKRSQYRKALARHRKSVIDSNIILRTNHVLYGALVPFLKLDGVEGDYVLGEGKLRAIDHAPRTLTGLHLLARTPHLRTVEWGYYFNLE